MSIIPAQRTYPAQPEISKGYKVYKKTTIKEIVGETYETQQAAQAVADELNNDESKPDNVTYSVEEVQGETVGYYLENFE